MPEDTGQFVLIAMLGLVALPVLSGSLLLLFCRLLGL